MTQTTERTRRILSFSFHPRQATCLRRATLQPKSWLFSTGVRGLMIGGILCGLLSSSGEVSAEPGALTQSGNLNGCISEDGSFGLCKDGRALDGASSVVVSPDGKHVYVAGRDSDAVAVFTRSKTTGALSQSSGLPGCISETGSFGQCADGKALDFPVSVALSPDGNHVYVASAESDAVVVFARNKTTGALTQLSGTEGCISETGSFGQCTDGKALNAARFVVVSPDGTNVYVVGSALAVFARDETTGTLTQLSGPDGCISETGSFGQCTDGKALVSPTAVTVSPDGKHVYVTSLDSNAVAVFARDKTTGALTQLEALDGCISEVGNGPCTDGRALPDPHAVTVSPDGKHVYVVSDISRSVAVFARDKTTGALTQLEALDGCISEFGEGPCADGRGLPDPRSVAVSKDGKHVYVASDFFPGTVAVFARNKTTGVLTQLEALEGCISETGSGPCADGRALDGANSVVVSPDGKHVYVASFSSDAVAVLQREK